ncbi:MAG: TetR/AcrR family transcriptional regulator [Deltaproteobacteria bacterium]|nr:TetR/AcrR family transcriptional regulator [Deltaproteobacteria bacterium]MBW2254468.1 TetR/AcrR family transcriptional regulator [Deltaproteobacteria bacterium]
MARPRQFSDEEILHATRACILENGPSVSTNVIAERIGISQATLFKRFGTKEDLFLAALVSTEDPPWMATADRGPRPGDLREQLIEIALQILGFFRERMPCIMALRFSGITPERMFARFPVPPPVRGMLAMRSWFATATERGWLQEHDAESSAMALLGTLHFRGFAHNLSPGAVLERDDQQWAEAVVDLLLQGLLPREEP